MGYSGFSGNISSYLEYFKNDAQNYQKNPKTKEKNIRSFSYLSKKLAQRKHSFDVNFRKDILPLLGNNFSLVFSGIEEVSFMKGEGEISPLQLVPSPVPQCTVIIEAKDKPSAYKLSALISETFTSFKNKEGVSASVETLFHDGIEVKRYIFSDSPVTPIFFIVDRQCVISSSFSFTKNIINNFKNRGKLSKTAFIYSFDSERIFPKGSYVSFLDFATVIRNLAQTKIVKFIKPTVGFFTQGKIMSGDVDTIIDILDDISIFAQAYHISEEGCGEGIVYLGIEGL